MEDIDETMAQEDQTQNFRNGGINGGLVRSSNKKQKQKKVPQRGLGVAQLEKIRMEEQQKRDASSVSISPSPCCSVSSSTTKSSSYLHHLPVQNNFNHSHQPSSGSPTAFRSPLSLQQHIIDIGKVPSNVSLPNCGGFEAGGWSSVSIPNVPKSYWNPQQEFDYEKEGFPFLPSLPFDSNPIWPLPNLVQRTTQYHQPSSSMVNVPSGTSSSTPVPHFSKEPPSNQNYSGSGVPMRPAEKMVGMKRPYPFSLDVPPVPAFNYKLPSSFTEMRSNATTTSCGNGGVFNYDASNSTFREVPSCSASNSEPNSKKSNKENEKFNGDFLTLAPPSPTSCPTSNLNSSSEFMTFHNQEYPELESKSFQGNIEDQIPPSPGYSRFNQQKQQHLYCFFPPAAKKAQIGQTTARIQNRIEEGEIVDLNLKL